MRTSAYVPLWLKNLRDATVWPNAIWKLINASLVLKEPIGYVETDRKKTFASCALDALDKFSTAHDDDLERFAHLLGKSGLFNKNCRI